MADNHIDRLADGMNVHRAARESFYAEIDNAVAEAWKELEAERANAHNKQQLTPPPSKAPHG